ncbi:hypothetical protein K432DRAFT_422755 [Lepidopterella palustris CBS 459.81]|uniref:UBZ4-type domain-containing protein n=1 Tax=Lepidopterella palustris CBS 459.81 TaxID=1314670 RepID=A0A8E2EII7_9PEZI|nr:hypothetical protein K432DRAFT_422755 [Lepidopterella palustris CBS 459.81]
MQRPRNRQTRSDNSRGNNSRGRGTPHGRGGRPQRPQNPTSTFGSVPTAAQLNPGTPVSIILKIDQPTGGQVQGIVAELLTRGDHPRGIKVRLRDGRVGRAQKVVSEDDGMKGEEEAGGTSTARGRNGENDQPRSSRPLRYTNVREDEYVYNEYDGDQAPKGSNLADYLPDLERLEWDGIARASTVTFESAIATCPVCETFEGDEAAVAHHVECHFKKMSENFQILS